MKISKITENDQAQLSRIAEMAIEKHVTPMLNELGRQMMLDAQRREAGKIHDTSIYCSRKATIDGTIAGYVAWTQIGKVAHLYVSPEHQGVGIGRALMNCVREQVHEKTIYLRASINAVGFYKRLGFMALDTEQNDKGIRYVPMELSSRS